MDDLHSRYAISFCIQTSNVFLQINCSQVWQKWELV